MKTIFLLLLFILTLEAKERIISLSPSLSEIVYALKKGESLVATSEYSLYPKEAAQLPIIGNYFSPNIEKILTLTPTLVIGQDFNKETLDKLKTFHIKTLMLRSQTIDEIKESILKLSNELQADPAPLIDEIDLAIKNSPKSKTPHKVMIVYGLEEDLRSNIFIAGKGIFFDDIISLSNNTNAYSSRVTNQPSLSYENVIALDPDQIIIIHSRASNPNINEQKALNEWYKLPTNASKNRRITVIDESYIHIPSHRVALTIKRLCEEMSR